MNRRRRRMQQTGSMDANSNIGSWGVGVAGRPIPARGSRAVHRKVSPEIRSLQEGRIRLGSVAPLLSRRAKALAMAHYADYSEEDEEYDIPDRIDEDRFSEDDYDDETYDNHRFYGHCSYRHAPPRMKLHCEKDEQDYANEPEPSSLSLPTPSLHFLRTQSFLKFHGRRKSTAVDPPLAVATLSPDSVLKKAASGCIAKARNKNSKAIATVTLSRTRPITRSQQP